MPFGKVYLVGAGPGYPGLLTLRAKSLLEQADVVLYDYLVNPQILNFCHPRAKKIYVGKRGQGFSLAKKKLFSNEQQQINRLLARWAKKVKTVVRLKGGDPLIFSRGAEEAKFLAERNIPFEIVPGISSALAAPAYAGIPLTERQISSQLTIITGQEYPQKKASAIDWSKILPRGTLVILMGIENLSVIVGKLIQNGWSPFTPIALIEWGTLPSQRTLVSTLKEIVSQAVAKNFQSPAVVVVGQVVKMREKLSWFENKPLFGQRVVITRSEHQLEDLADLLSEQGAEVIPFPVIKIVPAKNYSALDKAIKNISSYDWLIFTSANGVHYFFQRLILKSLRGSSPQANDRSNLILRQDRFKIKICCVGPRTAEQLSFYGITSDCLPKEYRTEAIVLALGKIKGKKILLPRSTIASPLLPQALTKRGAKVEAISVYDTKPEKATPVIKKMLVEENVDWITFTSPSTVKNFLKKFSQKELNKIFSEAKIASLGPITSPTLRQFGIQPTVEAHPSTLPALVEAMKRIRHSKFI